MQKLPEASDRKKGRRMRKEKGPPDKKEEDHALNLPTASGSQRWANLSLVATVSINNMSKYKKLRNGPIELRTKTLDLDKLPKATNPLLKL